MIPSTTEYNLLPAHGILLGGVALNYRQSDPIESIHYPGFNYHYEFLIPGNGNLYACIHCTHRIPHHNLSLLINGIFPLISARLAHHGIPGIVNVPLPGLPVLTHVINIQCLRHEIGYAANNATIMRHMIDITQNYGI